MEMARLDAMHTQRVAFEGTAALAGVGLLLAVAFGLSTLITPLYLTAPVRELRPSHRPAIAPDAARLTDNKNGSEAPLLVREGAGLEPMIERWLAAGKFGDVVDRGERFGSRKDHGSPLSDVAGLPWRRPLRQLDHFGGRR